MPAIRNKKTETNGVIVMPLTRIEAENFTAFEKITIPFSGCSNDILVLRAKDGIAPKFLYYVLSDDAFFDHATATAKGTKMPRGDKNAIMHY